MDFKKIALTTDLAVVQIDPFSEYGNMNGYPQQYFKVALETISDFKLF